ncbi:ImmA/IrrE family metallo-endopeptidase [Nocardia asiatica]|nr:ImmA/IrrE family metallo-endopeptidase [Nocardia asiatica]
MASTRRGAVCDGFEVAGLSARLRRRPSTRSRLESLASTLQLRNGWDVDELVSSVERIRGRRIVRAPLPDSAPVGLCGLWLAGEADDVVLFRPSSDPLMERHVVAHELAHMLLEHGRKTSPGELATLLVGLDVGRGLGSNASMVQTARGASAYDDDREYEAELLATLIETAGRRKGILRRYRRASAF